MGVFSMLWLSVSVSLSLILQVRVRAAVVPHPTESGWRCTTNYCLSDLSTKPTSREADQCPDKYTDAATQHTMTYGLATIQTAADQSEVQQLLDYTESGWTPTTGVVWIGLKTFGYAPNDARWFPYTQNEAGNGNAFTATNGVFSHWVEPIAPAEWRSGCFYLQDDGDWFLKAACGAAGDMICNRNGRYCSPSDHNGCPPRECTGNTVKHIQFVLDESGSVSAANFYNVLIPFVVQMVEDDINGVSVLDSIAFGADVDSIYSFGTSRTAIIAALNAEAYDGGTTNTYLGIKTGIDRFIAAGYTSLSDENVMFLFTDGVFTAGTTDPCATTTLKNLLNANNIRLIVVKVNNFVSTFIECLVDNTATDIITADSFLTFYPSLIQESVHVIACGAEGGGGGAPAVPVPVPGSVPVFEAVVNSSAFVTAEYILLVISCLLGVLLVLCIYNQLCSAAGGPAGPRRRKAFFGAGAGAGIAGGSTGTARYQSVQQTHQ